MSGYISIDDISLKSGRVDEVLDDSETRTSCGHWANSSGTRSYDRKRVGRAKSMKLVDGYFYHREAEEINSDFRPCTPPVFVIDYRYPVQFIAKEIVSEIWSSRLSHPRLGRWPGSKKREYILVSQALAKMISFVDAEAALTSPETVLQWLENRASTAVTSLGSPWPDVICRKVKIRSYLSKAKSRRAVGKMLDAFSLLQAKKITVSLDCEQPLDLIELLVFAPTIRLDPVVKKL